MTEERIEELNDLLRRREILKNEIEAFDTVFKLDKMSLIFYVKQDTSAKENFPLIYQRDHLGYFDEALLKIYTKMKQELVSVQKAIEEI